MSHFKDHKLLLIVNVASACGFTKPKYTVLNSIYKDYQKDGLEILAFPCNQFMGQESKCEAVNLFNQDIKEFVRDKYQCQFPFFSKIDVNGENCHPIYAFLRNEVKPQDNFKPG